MPEPSKLAVKVTTESTRRPSKIGRLLTLELLSTWIRKLDLDDYTLNGLIALAGKYPAAALPSFKKNINLMIQRVRLQRQTDQQGEEINAIPERQETATSLDEAYNQVFDTGPQKTTITEDDLREWEASQETVEDDDDLGSDDEEG